MFADVRFRLRALFRRTDVERELDAELRFHVARQIEKLAAAGVPRHEAARRAALTFGGVAQLKEACRDARGLAALETLVQDVRYGLRTMRRAPVFTTTAILTIGLSTAALATVCTLGYTLWFRELPVERSNELVTISATRGQPDAVGPVSYPDYLAFRDATRTLSGLAAHYSSAPLFASAHGDAREMNGVRAVLAERRRDRRARLRARRRRSGCDAACAGPRSE
jgi:hypothetical protein